MFIVDYCLSNGVTEVCKRYSVQEITIIFTGGSNGDNLTLVWVEFHIIHVRPVTKGIYI